MAEAKPTDMAAEYGNALIEAFDRDQSDYTTEGNALGVFAAQVAEWRARANYWRGRHEELQKLADYLAKRVADLENTLVGKDAPDA